MKKLLVFLLCFTLLIPSFNISAKDDVYSLDNMSEDKIVDFIYDRATDFSYTSGETKYFSSNIDGYDGDFLYRANLYIGNSLSGTNNLYKHTEITFCIKSLKRAQSIYNKLYKKLDKYNKIINDSNIELSYIDGLSNTKSNINTILKTTTRSGCYTSFESKFNLLFQGYNISNNISEYCPLSISPISTGYVINVCCYEGEEIDIDDSAKFDLGELEDTPEFKLSNTKGYKLKITFDSKDNYEIQIATDKSFKKVVKEESINATNKTYTLEKGTYYVRAKFTDGDYSDVKSIKLKK